MLKTVSSISNAIGALNYKGTWNATTNNPALASGVGTKGDYYVVGTAGSTALDGISNWGIGDWAAFNGTAWQRVEGGADLNGVNLSVSGTSTFSGVSAAQAVAILNASRQLISTTNLQWDVANNFLGVGISPNYRLHVATSSSSIIAAFRATDTTASAKTIIAGNSQGDLITSVSTTGNGVIYSDSGKTLAFGTNGSTTSALTIATTRTLTALQTYSTTVGATNRDLFIDDTGLIGYVSSTRESKKDIANLSDVSWLLQLSPVSYKRRKKQDVLDDDGNIIGANYLEDTYTETEYGLIADDAEQVNAEICFYDKAEDQQKLAGIHYSKLIAPMLKLLQQQQQQIEDLKTEINTLKGN